MILIERNKAIGCIAVSLGGMIVLGWLWRSLVRREVDDSWLLLAGMGLFLVYAYGCSCLAKAKGQTSALVLTAVFGILPPLIILLLLPDVNRHPSHAKRPG